MPGATLESARQTRYTTQTDGRALLARDLETRPEGITAIDAGLAAHIQTLVAPVEVDLDAPLSPDNE
jgi:hypothetical protein